MAERENRRGNRRDREETPEFADRLVAINRVSKTVKGGKRFGFAAHEVVPQASVAVRKARGQADTVHADVVVAHAQRSAARGEHPLVVTMQ